MFFIFSHRPALLLTAPQQRHSLHFNLLPLKSGCFLLRVIYTDNEGRTIAPITRDQRNYNHVQNIKSPEKFPFHSFFPRYIPPLTCSHKLLSIRSKDSHWHTSSQTYADKHTQVFTHILRRTQKHTRARTHTTHSYMWRHSQGLFQLQEDHRIAELHSRAFDDAFASRSIMNYLLNYSIINKSHHKKLS